MMETVLKVNHNGQPKMIGKCFKVRNVFICFHEAFATQYHIKYDSPGGIDVLAVDWLLEHDIITFHHYNKHTQKLYASNLNIVKSEGVYDIQDNRHRLFLATSHWREFTGLIPYSVPWIDREIVLG